MKKLVILAVVLVVVAVSTVLAVNYHTAKPKFCGSCHIMNKPYNTWKDSKHKDVACVDCHYAPGKAHTIQARFRGLAQIFSYLGSEKKEREIRKKTLVLDISCTTSECHPIQKFMTKKYQFTDGIPYIHQTHEDKTIEGQKLHCNTCHQHIEAEEHFEVSREACYLCHFKNTKFNEGRARCALCHEIPTKSLQSQKSEKKPDEKPITHQTLERAGVSCNGCHYELVQGEGEIKEESCLDCHDAVETLMKADDKKLMHEQHVAGQNANCFNCHEPIQHKEIDFLDPIRENCSVCHPDHHLFQRLLLTGAARDGVPEMPGHMIDVRTNCLGCHVKAEKDHKGQKVIGAAAVACVSCHTERHEKMLENWKLEMKEEIGYAKEVEKEVETALAGAVGRVPEGRLREAEEAFERGRENLRIVEYGNGVHNKKYAIMLIDSALDRFDGILELLQEE